ncbi:MAG: tripartite tricarboxylate transporter permease [Thermoplasmatota archaeon]
MEWIAIGIAIGVLTGLVPGLHVNTLAAIALATVPLDMDVALALVAVGTVHTIVSILPAAYLGLPGEDTAIASLPAHQLVADGRGPLAIRISVAASTWAMVAVVLALLPVKWLLAAPLHGGDLLTAATPWILAGVLALLLWQEPRPAVPVIMLLAGALGWLARDWPTSNPWHVPASPLLPLLTGLFAAPTLWVATGHGVPPQRAGGGGRHGRQVMAGVTVAAMTSVLPGLTAAVATAMAGSRLDDPRKVLATLSSVNTAHHGFALAMLWIVGSTRSGLADAIRPALPIASWDGPIPGGLHAIMLVALAATVFGAIATLAMEPLMRKVVQVVPARPLHLGALLGLVLLVLTLTGIWGLVLFAGATAVGMLPLCYRVRRVHLAACLIVPILVGPWLPRA